MYGPESPMRTEQEGGDYVHAPQSEKRLRVGLLIGVVVLLLTLGGASLPLVLKVVGGPGDGLSSSPVREMTPMPTNTPTPTPTPTQALFSDNFANNSDGWDTSSDNGYTRAVSNRMLILANIKPGTILTESLPTNDIFDDFTVTITFTLLQADASDSAGIYVRGDSNLDHDYRIEINGNNTFDIVKEYLDANTDPQTSILVGPLKVPSLHPAGQQNTLQVALKGPRIVILINSILVSTVTDSNYTKGQIALFARAGNASNGVKVTFSSVEVDSASGNLPG